MELHLNILGFLLVILALVHIAFPRYFNWKEELKGLSMINRQMMYVHSLFIALLILMIGLLCLTSSKDLIETRLGNRIALGLCLFWSLRLIIQFFGYSSKLWKGKQLETIIHIAFSLLWTDLSIVFFMIFWSGK
jgi:hypothetical protein